MWPFSRSAKVQPTVTEWPVPQEYAEETCRMWDELSLKKEGFALLRYRFWARLIKLMPKDSYGSLKLEFRGHRPVVVVTVKPNTK